MAEQHSKEDYNPRSSWLKFYQSLVYIFDLELDLSDRLEQEQSQQKSPGQQTGINNEGGFVGRKQRKRTGARHPNAKIVYQQRYSEILESIEYVEQKLRPPDIPQPVQFKKASTDSNSLEDPILKYQPSYMKRDKKSAVANQDKFEFPQDAEKPLLVTAATSDFEDKKNQLIQNSSNVNPNLQFIKKTLEK